MAFKPGEGFTLFVAPAGTAPTTLTDPESMGSMFELGEIPDELAFQQVRSMIERFDRDSPGQTFIHPNRRKFSLSTTLNIDVASNTGLSTIQTALESNTDGIGSGGNLIYVAISNGTASDWLAHGTAGVADFSHTLSGTDVVKASLSLEFNGDATVTVHA